MKMIAATTTIGTTTAMAVFPPADKPDFFGPCLFGCVANEVDDVLAVLVKEPADCCGALLCDTTDVRRITEVTGS
jgi:hypothetical protein